MAVGFNARALRGGAGLAALATVLSTACGNSETSGSKIKPRQPIQGSGGSSGTSSASGDSGTSVSVGGASNVNPVGSGGSSGTFGSTGGTSSTGVTTGGACMGLPLPEGGLTTATDGGDGGACVGVTLEAEALPVDMYIMMDRSVSMAEPLDGGGTTMRWDGVRTAVDQFVRNPAAKGIGVGIQFFGMSGVRDDALDCDVNKYATPDVPTDLLPGVGNAIVAAIDNHSPGGLTPTLPALKGAVQYAKTWAGSHPGRVSVVVLVTDGFPTQCQNPVSTAEIAKVAEDAEKGNPRVLTFVIGLAGRYNLDSIARAGGTGNAFVIEGGDVVAPFVKTLLNITNSPLSCAFDIPAPSSSVQQVDPDKVQVVYTPAVGSPEEIPKLASVAQCDSAVNGGWYYDSPGAPKAINICPCSCARLGAGKVDVRLGCRPRPGILR